MALNPKYNNNNFYLCTPFEKKDTARLSDGVTGNTSPFGGEESWFEPRSDNLKSP